MKKLLLVLVFVLGCQCSFSQEIKKISITELESYINNSNKPLVVNFWATFCVPCIKEIPYFQSIIKNEYPAKIELLLVSLDLPSSYPDDISSFAKKRKFYSTIAWLNETNADIFCPRIDTAWSGSIPASLFVNNSSGYRKFYEKDISPEQLKKELKQLVGEQQQSN